jgi:hypothetical protein
LAELDDMGYEISMNMYYNTSAETKKHNADILEMKISNKEKCVIKTIIDNIVSMASELSENNLKYYACSVNLLDSGFDEPGNITLKNQKYSESLYDLEKFYSLESFTLFFRRMIQ